jgi:hypothetical protein
MTNVTVAFRNFPKEQKKKSGFHYIISLRLQFNKRITKENKRFVIRTVYRHLHNEI